MKRKIILALITIAITLGFTSCATFSGLDTISNNTILNAANFEYVKTVREQASTTYFLGLFGGKPEQKAIDRLRISAKLQPNQALTNYSITKSFTTFFGIISVKTVTATADIVQFK
jgi:hypothetical protein